MRTRVLPLLAVLALVAAAAACSGGDNVSSTTRAPSSTDAVGSAEPADAAGAHDGDKYGSSMDPTVVGVKAIGGLGDGPEAGDHWKVWTGINVCGRFVDMAAVAPQPAKGVSVDPSGLLTVAPVEGDPTGHDVTVGNFLALYGITAATGKLTFPPTVNPSTLRLPNGSIQLAGATLSTGDKCPETAGEVQVWYYTPEAVAKGTPIRVVVTDPQNVPIVADGSAIVVTFSPESSLPTLPPAALVG